MTARPPARRLIGMLVAFVLGLSAIGARLVLLQVKDAEAFQDLARQQRVYTIDLPAPRGGIFDRAGSELAVSLPAQAVFADPSFVTDPLGEARRLAPLLRVPARALEQKLSGDSRFVYLARQVRPRLAGRIRALGLAGIGFLDESRRAYPAGILAPQVLGFVGVDGQGLAGLELQYQDVLAGAPGTRVQEQDPAGHGIPGGERSEVAPVPGESLVLTIDKDVQFEAQRALAAAVKRNGAKGGTVLVMEPATGDILAMASYPLFDPAHYETADPQTVRARAITDVYEPGSVNKVITASAAVEESLFPLDRAFLIPDSYQVAEKVFHDAHAHPEEPMTLADVIAYSSNVGTIKVAQRLGQPRLADYLERFGFGRRTGIAFPGESRGILPPRDGWWGNSMGTIPIGQGIAVTPLQMASVYQTIANGGVWVQPRLVRGVTGADGEFTPAGAARHRRVVTGFTAERVTEMLAYAVEVGTGGAAAVPGYWVAGKTGTARKPLENARGYSDRYVASFIGFLPASAPRVVIAAILDEPQTVYGGIASAPLFREVARYALAHLRVPSAPRPAVPPHVVPID